MRDKRAAGIGYGRKYDFTKLSPLTPGPNIYNLVSEIDENKNKGRSMGLSRD